MQETFISDILPLPKGFHLVHCNTAEATLTLEVISTLPQVCCPLCGQPAERVHSRYLRTIADLPCAGRRVILHQTVRKFLCQNPSCERKIFSEQYPELVQPCAHKTNRLRAALEALGMATSGEVAARLAPKLGMSISAPTLLRHIKAVPCSLPQNVRVLGIDDWCWKRGQNYGTILVDLETHTVVDLLPDRSADSVQRWLEARPGIEIVSRDRGGIYADGAARGAKDAQQVADRWHLVKNLGDAVEKYLVRQRIQVPPLPQVQVKEVKAHVSQEANLPLKHRRLQAKRERKQELCEQARALAAQGWGMRSIAAHLGLARNTVRRYLRSEGDIPVATRPRQKSILDPYYDYIVERWQQGCPTARQLFQELCKKGYKGGETTVRDCVAHLRQSLPEMKRPPRGAKGPMPYTGCSYSPRELRWLLAKSEKNLRPEEKANLTRLLEASDEVRLLHRLLQQFLQMVRERKLTQLQSWLEEAFSSGIAELQGFVRGIERDRAAVEAALSLPWSQGQTEGQVNRLKMLKRQMYGRAGFTLLRQRVLHRA